MSIIVDFRLDGFFLLYYQILFYWDIFILNFIGQIIVWDDYVSDCFIIEKFYFCILVFWNYVIVFI